MNQALWLLLGLQGKALWRRTTRGIRTARGALLFIFGLLMIVLWILPSVVTAKRGPHSDPQSVQDMVPLIMLGSVLLTLLTTGGEKAIPFHPAEVDMLFAAPFTRRQILAYKITRTFAGAILSALLLSGVLLRHAGGWPQAVLGLFLAMLFLHLLSISMMLIGQSVGERAYTVGRLLFLWAIVAAIVIPVVPELLMPDKPSPPELAAILRHSQLGSILFAPLNVFGRLFTTKDMPHEGVFYAAIAVLIDLSMMLIVFWLDADYLEASSVRSRALYEKTQRVRQGGITALRPGLKARWTLPSLPYLGGAGPIIWRQMGTALRSSRGLLMLLVILSVAVAPAILSSHRDGTSAIFGAIGTFTFVLGATLRYDFRNDLDHMDHLKSLPASPAAIAIGEIATPTLVLTLCDLLFIVAIVAVTRRADPMLIAAAVLALPVNTLLFSIENWIFLKFPTRLAANPADFQGYGRQMLILFAKMLLLALAGAIAGLAGFIVRSLTDSRPLTILTITLVACGLAVATFPFVAQAFRKFDVATDTPP